MCSQLHQSRRSCEGNWCYSPRASEGSGILERDCSDSTSRKTCWLHSEDGKFLRLTNKRPRSCLVFEVRDSIMSTSGPYGMPLIMCQTEVIDEATK